MNYKISLDYDDYFCNAKSLRAKDLEVVGDSIFFTTDKESLDFLNANNIAYMLHSEPKKKLKAKIGLAYPIVFGLMICLFLIIMNHFRVSKIVFNGDYPINDTIREYIEEENRRILCFDFHKNDYDKLSRSLRATFYEYEWITVFKKGDKVYVNIEPTTSGHASIDEGVNANIVAKKDGVISSFYVFNGSANLHEKGFVKKGDVLINATPLAKGVILATTYEELTVNVNKKRSDRCLKSEYQSYQSLKLFNSFNFNLFKKKSYPDFKLTTKKAFDIPYLFTVYENREYKIEEENYEFSLVEAKEYAKSIITADFLKTQTLKEEKILSLEVLTAVENEQEFVITLLVKKLESIGEVLK